MISDSASKVMTLSAASVAIMVGSFRQTLQTWAEQTLRADPEKLAPGQRMGINVPDAKDRADLIAYLKKAGAAGK